MEVTSPLQRLQRISCRLVRHHVQSLSGGLHQTMHSRFVMSSSLTLKRNTDPGIIAWGNCFTNEYAIVQSFGSWAATACNLGIWPTGARIATDWQHIVIVMNKTAT